LTVNHAGKGTMSAEVKVGDSQVERELWIETRQGGLFFVNAILVAPELVVLFPLTLQLLVGLIAPERNPSPFLDTIPFVASKSIPYLGWLLVIPIWTTLKNLRIESLPIPRAALLVFLLLHVSFLGYTLLSWVG
jgi:hypothetical protein